MFTGLIEEVGRLVAKRERGGAIELTVAASRVLDGAIAGDSIAVDGCCLTIESFAAGQFTCFATPETLARTTLGDRAPGDGLNLEVALTLAKPLGGHLVQGHVDGVGTVVALASLGEAWDYTVELPAALAGPCIEKGSIALDGVSLTIARLADAADGGARVTIAVIPATYEKTNLRERRPGDRVNVETDLIGKYVRRFLERAGLGGAGGAPNSGGITRELLREAGFDPPR